MMKLIWKLILLLAIVNLYSCDYYQYAKEVSKEAKGKMLGNKEFIHNMSFEGKVKNKELCSNCKLNKYSVSIEIDSSFFDSKIIYYPPYYEINNNLMKLAVTKEAFNFLIEEDVIHKSAESNYIVVRNKRIPILSNKNNKWLP